MVLQSIHYRLHIYGDLHVGSGVGIPGLIDSMSLRDHQGFAILPGSEIKGLVRDSCIRLLKCSCDPDAVCSGQKSWKDMTRMMEGFRFENLCDFKSESLCILCALFGSPKTPGAWWFSPASYDETYRDSILHADASLSTRDKAISAHASMDDQTKRAEEDHLFNLETVRPADVWVGEIAPLPALGKSSPKASPDELLGWLTASLLFIRRIGGRRRRGWGRCRFEILADENGYPGNKSALDALGKLLGKGNEHGVSANKGHVKDAMLHQPASGDDK
jgi:CRISPR-associated protein Csx10